jgi:carboxyl-terminal processing protease
VNANEFNKMVDWLTEKGVTATADEIAYSKEHIITLFKAFLGRNVFDDEGFYPIYHQIDPIFQKALSEIKQNNRV